MDKLGKIISNADFVGMQLKPTLNGTNRIKSFFGGLISIIATICISFGFIYFGVSMAARDKPIMNVVQRMESNATIHLKDNPLSLVVYNKNAKMIHHDPEFRRAVKLEALLYRVRPDPDNIFTLDVFKGDLAACKKEDVEDRVYDQLRSISMQPETGLCPDSSTLVNAKGEKYEGGLYLQNRYADTTSDYLYYRFKLCDEKEDPGCADYLAKAGRISIVFYRLDYYIDQTDFEDPIKINVTQSGYSLNNVITQTVFIPNRINEIVTDSSMFLTEEKREIYYSSINPSMSIRQFNPEERLLLEFVVSAERIVTVNQRRYMKIPELLANMGGFMKAALVIGNLLSYLNSDYIYYLTVKRIELNYQKNAPKEVPVLDASSEVKSSKSPIKLKPLKTKLPSFSEYFLSLFVTKKQENLSRKDTFKYLELNYLIERLLTVESMDRAKANNFVKE